MQFVRQVGGQFLDELNIQVYSEHLSFSRDSQGYLWTVTCATPAPENIGYLADRISWKSKTSFQRPLVMENISYYHNYGMRCQRVSLSPK